MDILEEVTKLVESGVRTVQVTYNDGTKSKLRVFKSTSGSISCFGHRRRKYGYVFPYQSIIHVAPVISRKSTEQKWHDGWKKVRSKLIASGLWDVIVAEIDLVLTIGYDRLNEASRKYWELQAPEKSEIFKSLYPELMIKRDDGTDYIDTSVIWNYYHLPKVKQMRFSKYQNDERLQAIQEAMNKREKYSTDGQYGYDISFEYNPERQRAWYSEEYRGCGNGHYYIALSATHALFREDD